VTHDLGFLRARERAADEPLRDHPPLPEALTVPVYDNHTHLEFEDGAQPLHYRELLDRASSVGVRGVVQVGTDLETSRWSAEVAAREPRVLAAVALHPNDAPELEEQGLLDEHIAGIADLADRSRVRAVGETGLDFYRTGEEGRDAQIRSFEAHIAIAKEFDLALQIHDRDAHAEVIEVLRRVGPPDRVVFHCFSGDRELAEFVADAGWYCSFAGTVTFKNANDLRDALEAIPRSRILIETDAPFLTPMPWRGHPNASYLIPHTLRFMANHLGTDPSMLAAQISSNTEDVYGRWDDSPVDPPTGPFELPVLGE
jgi:TatD DNase family protein